MSDAPVRPLSEAAQRVQDALRSGGFANTVIELEVAVKTAAAASTISLRRATYASPPSS